MYHDHLNTLPTDLRSWIMDSFGLGGTTTRRRRKRQPWELAPLAEDDEDGPERIGDGDGGDGGDDDDTEDGGDGGDDFGDGDTDEPGDDGDEEESDVSEGTSDGESDVSDTGDYGGESGVSDDTSDLSNSDRGNTDDDQSIWDLARGTVPGDYQTWLKGKDTEAETFEGAPVKGPAETITPDATAAEVVAKLPPESIQPGQNATMAARLVQNAFAAAQKVDPSLLRPLAEKAWQQESGRSVPFNAGDAANREKYIEDWMGTFRDFKDPATKTPGIAQARRTVMEGVAAQTASRVVDTVRQQNPDALSPRERAVQQERQLLEQQVQQGTTSRADADTRLRELAEQNRVSDLNVPGNDPLYPGRGTDQGRGGPITSNAPSYNFANDELGAGPRGGTLSAAMMQGDPSKPLDAAVRVLLAGQQGSAQPVAPGGDQQATVHLASAISHGESWAQPALDAIAQMAWYRESGGREGPPEQAPASYVKDWVNAWQAGQDVPMAKELNQQLRSVGALTPDTPLQVGYKADLLKGLDQGRMISDPNYRAQMSQAITKPEADAICGPIAAVAFARANGRDPSLGEALALAKEVGWTQGGGMNGVANQQALLKRLGVESRLDGEADAEQIIASVRAGKPVIVSTGAHYYVISSSPSGEAYNEKTGKFFVGATGRAISAGANDWMDLSDMKRQSGSIGNGTINGVLYMAEDPARAAASDASPAPVQGAPAAPQGPGASKMGQINQYAAPPDPINYKDPNATNGVGVGEIEDYTRRAAVERGIDPEVVLRIFKSEGGLTNPVLQNYSGQPAWGPAQLHIAAIDPQMPEQTRRIARDEPWRGFEGDQFQYHTGLKLNDPKGWKLAIDFALDTAAKLGSWSKWHGATKQGITTQGLKGAKAKGWGVDERGRPTWRGGDEARYYAGQR